MTNWPWDAPFALLAGQSRAKRLGLEAERVQVVRDAPAHVRQLLNAELTCATRGECALGPPLALDRLSKEEGDFEAFAAARLGRNRGVVRSRAEAARGARLFT